MQNLLAHRFRRLLPHVSNTGMAGSPMTVNSSGSSPADKITSYQWSFGDGQTSAGTVISHTCAVSGTHMVMLTASDGVRQATDTATATIGAEGPGGNQPPQAVIASKAIPRTSHRCYRFTGSASKDPDGQIVSDVRGLGDQNPCTSSVIEYCYARARTCQVTFTVTDDGNATAKATTAVVVP
jgi:hypothetical protein